MDTMLTQGGVVGILLVLVLREVFGFLNKKSRGVDCGKQAQQIDELWRWHNVVDSEGVRIWYTRKSLEKTMEKLATAIEAQTEMLRRMHGGIKDLQRTRA